MSEKYARLVVEEACSLHWCTHGFQTAREMCVRSSNFSQSSMTRREYDGISKYSLSYIVVAVRGLRGRVKSKDPGMILRESGRFSILHPSEAWLGRTLEASQCAETY